jgi:hypothetical protein
MPSQRTIKGASLIWRCAVYLYAVLERPLAVEYGERVYALEMRVSLMEHREDEIMGMEATRERTVNSGGDWEGVGPGVDDV